MKRVEGTKRSYALIFFVCALLSTFATGAEANQELASTTVPMVLDHCRMTVEVEFQQADNSVHKARAWVDSGGTNVIVSEVLARELGVDLSAMPAGGGHSFDTKSPVPTMRLGGIALETEGMTVSVFPGRFARPGVQAACVLPARALRRLHLVFDYPGKTLIVARPGVLKPAGTPVPIKLNPDTGLVLVEAEIEGEKVALGLDTGSAGTWVSDKLTAGWTARHPDWPTATGAAGSTNFFGFSFETQGTLLRLPGLRIGAVLVTETAVLGLDQSLFDWYSQKSAGRVAGFLGADLLSRFRLEIDFSSEMSWWQAGPPRSRRDLDIVGLTLQPQPDGAFIVAGMVSRHGQPTVPGVDAGDRLLGVDSLEATNAPMGIMIDALRGEPGATRLLKFERAGKTFTVPATILRLP
jgi:hypothetical protein